MILDKAEMVIIGQYCIYCGSEGNGKGFLMLFKVWKKILNFTNAVEGPVELSNGCLSLMVKSKNLKKEFHQEKYPRSLYALILGV